MPRAHDRDTGEGDGVIDPGLIHIDALQHINVKVFAEDAASVRPGDVVAVFHRWIKDSLCPELLIDVAEYLHVPAGPGVMLIALEANYSLDYRENRPGLLYNRKTALEGSFRSRLGQAHGAALAACDRLEQDPAFGGKLKFSRNSMEVFINDRLLAPNTAETAQVLIPEMELYFPGHKISKVGEPRDLLRFSVTK